MDPAEQHDHRYHGQQNQIHGQDIEVIRDISQCHQANQAVNRIVHERHQIQGDDIVLRVGHQSGHHVGADNDHCCDGDEHGQMRPVDLKAAQSDPRCAHEETMGFIERAKGQGGGKAGAEDEHFRRV